MSKEFIPIHHLPAKPVSDKWYKKFGKICVFTCIIAYLFYSNRVVFEAFRNPASYFSFLPDFGPQDQTFNVHDYLSNTLVDDFTFVANMPPSIGAPQEIIDVTPPLPSYISTAVPVYENEIITSHLFGSSWNEPAIADYVPPSIEFNTVVINITTNSSGVQYDRLSHLFLSGVPILRSSTAEPGNRNITFTVSKDLSEYLYLFKSTGKLIYQLDNIVDDKLTGAFIVSINIAYYNIALEKPETSSILLKSIETKSVNNTALTKLFSVLDGPATSIIPLTEQGSKTPLIYLPSNSLDIELPVLDETTVAAIFRLFISGNADEEFWYSNVIDANKDKIGSKIGKGPIRLIKTYIDGKLVSVQSPRPVIYTGGISPTLWSAVVGTGAFDVGHIDVDLTAFLPILWTSNVSIKVVVETGSQYPSFPIYPPHPPSDTTAGENWIASASLLSWTNENVTSSLGLASSFLSPPKEIVISPPSSPMKLTQVVNHEESASTAASFNYTIDQTTILFSYVSENSVSFSNVQNYKDFGKTASIVSNIKNSQKISITPLLTKKAICSYETSSKFVTILNMVINDTLINETIVNVSLVQTSSFSEKVSRGKKFEKLIKYGQNGTAELHLSDSGNFGTGQLRTKLSVSGKPGFKRTVDSENGHVTSDSLAFGNWDALKEDTLFIEKANLDTLNLDHPKCLEQDLVSW